MDTLSPGTRLGRFEIVAPLGAGGMGRVYRARDARLNRDVALKFLYVDSTQDRTALERFQREARAVSALNHPNIITVYDVGEIETGYYIAMELVTGRTLRALIQVPPPVPSLMSMTLQMAQALRAAHAAGIVHRDIKPENIMVREDGYVKVLDFGLARLQETVDAGAAGDTMWQTQNGIVMGTLPYMSPEQSRGQLAESASDVFSLGLVLYEVATGSHPFIAASTFDVVHGITADNPVPPSSLRLDLPLGFDALVLQMLQKEPSLRPTSEDVIARLEADASVAIAAPKARARTSETGQQRTTVGHAAEGAALREEFQRLARGRGAMVCIAGEPGAGKTTLIGTFLADLVADGVLHRVARGQCSERLGATGAYLPIIDSLTGLLRGDSGEAGRTMRLLAPSWYSQLAVSDSSSQAGTTAFGRSPEKMIHELALFVEELARQQPLIWFIDDVHWADLSTVEMIAYLCQRFESMPVLLIVTYRPAELHSTRHPFLAVKLEYQSRGICREIPLSFLSEADTRAYLTRLFPRHTFPDALTRVLHKRTEGNPLFLAELVRDLRARGVVSEQGERWALTRSIQDVESSLPESIRSMIQRKIDYLDEADRRLVLAAAAQGYEFDSTVIALAMDRDPSEVEERLDQLDRLHGVVTFVAERELPERHPNLRYRFVHVLYQNALYGSLRGVRKTTLSAAVASAILRCYGDSQEKPAAELAFLFEVARDLPSAAAHYLLAARNAARISAHVEAITLARRALAMLAQMPNAPERSRRELDILVVLSLSLTVTKGYTDPEVEEAFGRAWQLCRETPEDPVVFFLVLLGLWRYNISRGALLKATELGDELLKLANGSVENTPRIHADVAVGITLTCRGELATGCAYLERGASAANDEPLPSLVRFGQDALSAAQLWLVLGLAAIGRVEEARALEEQALARLRRISHPFSLAYGLTAAARFWQFLGDVDRTQDRANEAIAVSDEQSFRSQLVLATIYRQWTCSVQGSGRVDELRDAVAAYRRSGAGLLVPHFLLLLADAYGRTREFGAAFAALAEAADLCKTTDERLFEPEIHRLRGALLIEGGGDDLEAEACFQRALEAATARSATLMQLRAAAGIGQLWQRKGRLDEARDLLTRTVSLFTEHSHMAELQQVRGLLAQLV